MDITFATKKLAKQLNEGKSMTKLHGAPRAKKLQVALAKLWAAPSLAVFAPPMRRPHRCHELTGDRQGQLSIDLDHPFRLLFRANHDPLPILESGGPELGGSYES